MFSYAAAALSAPAPQNSDVAAPVGLKRKRDRSVQPQRSATPSAKKCVMPSVDLRGRRFLVAVDAGFVCPWVRQLPLGALEP